MPDPSNRKQRVDNTIPVRFADAREFLVEYSSNISLGGVFVRTSSPAAFGTTVHLTLELPGTNQSIPVSGQVAFILSPEQAAREGKVPGMGVRFSRLEGPVQEALSAYVAGLRRTSKGRVLLVDDDVVQLQKLGDMMRSHNLNVTTVSSAVKALEVVKFGGIDFIVSDINMPRMDGFEFRDNLRNNPKTASIPFAFLTASMDDSDRQIAGELGVRDFLVKPVDEPALVALLRAVLGDAAFLPGGEDDAGGNDPAAMSAKKRTQQRRIVDIAYRKFVALGLDTRFTADEKGVFGQLALRTVSIQDPLTGAKLPRAGFYSVGHDRAKPFWPRALGALPMIPILDLPDSAALEREVAALFHRRMEQARDVKELLDKFGIQNRYEPATLRVLGRVRIGMEEVAFSVRDKKTLFLESLNGRSFGSVAGMRARMVDISDAKGGVDVEMELETITKRMKEELARTKGPDLPPARAFSATGSAIESTEPSELSGPDTHFDDAAAPDPASAGSRPPPPLPAHPAIPSAAPVEPVPADAPAAEAPAPSGVWLGAPEDEEDIPPPANEPELSGEADSPPAAPLEPVDEGAFADIAEDLPIADPAPVDEAAFAGTGEELALADPVEDVALAEPEPAEKAASAEEPSLESAPDPRAFELEADPDAPSLEVDMPEPPVAEAAPVSEAPPADPEPEVQSTPAAAPEPEDVDLPPEEVEARQWADDWNGDESAATPQWSMDQAGAPAGSDPPVTAEVPAAMRDAPPELDSAASPASDAAVASAGAPDGSDPGDAAPATMMVCTACGKTYPLGDDLEDERLLLQCPECVAQEG